MKKRPGKRIIPEKHKDSALVMDDHVWNACHDAHTEWLPSAREIEQIIQEVRKEYDIRYYADKFSKAIRKRLE